MVTLKKKNEKLDWQGHLERWRRSGQTQTEYCKDNGIKVTTFSGWKCRREKKLRTKGSAKSGLVKVPEQMVQSVAAPAPTAPNNQMVV